MAATLDPSGLNSALTLSNGNLTVEHTGADADANVILSSPQTSGKYYVETTINVFTTTDYNTIQFGLATSGIGNNALLWASSNSVGTGTAGAGWLVNYSGGGATASYVQGDTVDFAWDAGAGNIWMRVNNGAWYGSNSSGNPGAGTNGFSFAPGGALSFRVSLYKQNQKVTFTTASGSWARSAPSGFGEFPGSGIDGTLAATDTTDTTAVSGSFSTTGTLASTDTKDTTAVSGVLAYSGTLAATEGQDVSAFSSGTTGTLAATDTADTTAIAGSLATTGTLAATDSPDTSAIRATVPVTDSAGSGGARAARSAYELARALAERRRKRDEEPAPEPVREPVAPEAAERALPPALPPPPAAVILASPAVGGPNLWTMARTAQMRRALDERRRLAQQADDDDAALLLLIAS